MVPPVRVAACCQYGICWDRIIDVLSRRVSFPPKTGSLFWHGKGFVMARKRHSDEDILKLLGEIEVKLSAGSNVQSACRGVGISDATYCNWRKRFGGMGRHQTHPDLSWVTLGERI